MQYIAITYWTIKSLIGGPDETVSTAQQGFASIVITMGTVFFAFMVRAHSSVDRVHRIVRNYEVPRVVLTRELSNLNLILSEGSEAQLRVEL